VKHTSHKSWTILFVLLGRDTSLRTPLEEVSSSTFCSGSGNSYCCISAALTTALLQLSKGVVFEASRKHLCASVSYLLF
jgi:hypothetical protein